MNNKEIKTEGSGKASVLFYEQLLQPANHPRNSKSELRDAARVCGCATCAEAAKRLLEPGQRKGGNGNPFLKRENSTATKLTCRIYSPRIRPEERKV